MTSATFATLGLLCVFSLSTVHARSLSPEGLSETDQIFQNGIQSSEVNDDFL